MVPRGRNVCQKFLGVALPQTGLLSCMILIDTTLIILIILHFDNKQYIHDDFDLDPILDDSVQNDVDSCEGDKVQLF